MDIRFQNEVKIPFNSIVLKGNLLIPEKAKSIILFSHGGVGGRFSSRNRVVANDLNKNNVGTLLFDLLTPDEDICSYSRLDIGLLADRLIAATEWLKEQEYADGCRLAYFGASTGTAAALKAAVYLPWIAAVVSRGGRPDLAMEVLEEVESPTLLMVGSQDNEILKLNEKAYALMNCEKRLEVISGATHLFKEPGKMNEVAKMTYAWFEKYILSQPVHQDKIIQE